MEIQQALEQAALWIKEADLLIITAGAGMGVDSGLPDFRGQEGFWKAYPALGRKHLDFSRVASPFMFHTNPRLAWGFYGHRLQLYRNTQPHPGFEILKQWAQSKAHGIFVYTSNVDGQFQKAGISPNHILECHGSIHHLQCLQNCKGHYWSAQELEVSVDEEECQWLGAIPTCPDCGGTARPMIMMFNDSDWISARTEMQRLNWESTLKRAQNPVILEMGAGLTISSIRRAGEHLHHPLIRINPRDFQLPAGQKGVSLPMGALESLLALEAEFIYQFR